MDITTLAAWGEFIGGIAVVVSLVYLASQIRQNSRLLRTSTSSAVSSANNDINLLMAQDSELMRKWREGRSDRSSMSEADRHQYDSLMGAYMNTNNQQYQFAVDAVIPPAVWDSTQKFLRRELKQPGAMQWWSEFRFGYSDEFRDFVDGLIREGEAAG